MASLLLLDFKDGAGAGPETAGGIATGAGNDCIPHCASLRDLAGDASIREIRALAAAVRSRVDAAGTAADKVGALNRFFFDESGFQADRDLRSPESLLPAAVLARRQGYCVGLAGVFLLLAAELGMPVAAVPVPGHLFVRYDDGRTRVNIELVENGAAHDDEWYSRQYAVPAIAIAKGVFLRPLHEREFLGIVYANLGALRSQAGDFTGSRVMYEAAIDAAPRLPSAHYNLGNDLLQQGRHRKAVRSFGRALRLHPTDLWALNNRGLAYCRLGRIGRARRDFEAALAINPDFALAAANLAGETCPSRDDRAD